MNTNIILIRIKLSEQIIYFFALAKVIPVKLCVSLVKIEKIKNPF